MIIISEYEERYNEDREVFYIVPQESAEVPLCPICSGTLTIRDSRRRHVIQPDESRKCYLLRRLRCKVCRKLHTELPACIQPRKHYGVVVIEGELDQRRKDCPAEESTRRRWRNAFRQEKNQIEGALRASWTKAFQKKIPLLHLRESILDGLISRDSGWLSIVNLLLINAGHGLHTRFAF